MLVGKYLKKSSLGTLQILKIKVKYLRALEESYQGLLNLFSGVLKANVKIAIQKRQFYWKKKWTTASAVYH